MPDKPKHYTPTIYYVKPWGDGNVCTHSLFATPGAEKPVDFPNPYKMRDEDPDEAPAELYVTKTYEGDSYYSSLRQACDREPPPEPGTTFLSAMLRALYDLVQTTDGLRNGDHFILEIPEVPPVNFRVMQFHVVEAEDPREFSAGVHQCVSDWHGAGLQEVERMDALFYDDKVPGCSSSFRWGYMTAAYNRKNKEMGFAYVECWPHA
jgi:hypothetical protein